MTLSIHCLPIAVANASIEAKDKLGDSFGTKPHLSTGPAQTAKLSQNCTGKQTDLNTMLESS
jgi:hypothetical protein